MDNSTKNLEQLKRDYAELLIREGINLQKGQRLAISCPVEGADFARLCVEEAYKAGCSEVIMQWTDDAIKRMKYLYGGDEIFDRVNKWDVDFAEIITEEGAGWLTLYSEDPDLLKGVDPDRITRAKVSSGKALEKVRQREMRSDFPWTVASIPSTGWAKAVFPDLSEEEAIEKLWEEILKACRVGGDAVADWRAHSEELRKRVDQLTNYDFKYLRYKNAAGTDVEVELPEGHIWLGGCELAGSGTRFSANIPTEEVFTLPKKNGVNGTIVSTKPLSLNGTLIEGMKFIVKEGKIVEVSATRGEEVLKDAIAVDEGASYFGEVALVPHDSPISNSGVLFLNTLFDENASCHFAFGAAYPCIRDANNKTDDELRALGANDSMTHVDFMVGSEDLEITGVTHSGEEVAVFRNGNFAL